MLWKVLALALASALSLHATAHARTSSLPELTMGLHGPIHSVKTTVKKLSADPRHEPKLHVIGSPDWIEFDAEGRVIQEEHGLRSNGTPYRKIRNSYHSKDEDDVTRTANGKTFREQTTTRPDGTVETTTLHDGALVSRTTDITDKEGNRRESTSYDASGEISDRWVYHYKNGKMTEMQAWGPRNAFVQHTASEFNSDGDLVVETFYDQKGKPVTTFSFDGARLRSYRQDPECGCSQNFGRRTKDVSYSYATRPDGSLETTVNNHPGTDSNREPSDEEIYAGDHVLVEKLTFTYERDAHGNWTRRIVSAWDKKTGQMVPIEEDTRVLTYY